MRLSAAMVMLFSLLAGTALLAGMTQTAEANEMGKKVFKKCVTCHSLEAGKHKLGPSLAGLYGRVAGGAEGYKYSKDMKAAGAAGLVWSEETLAAYIKKDGKKGPKTYIGELIGKKKAKIKMAFPGLKKDEDVTNLIAYMSASGAAAN